MPQAQQIAFIAEPNLTFGSRFLRHFVPAEWRLLCHFSLDVMCHGYIDEKIQAGGVSHAEIEIEFDRMLTDITVDERMDSVSSHGFAWGI